MISKHIIAALLSTAFMTGAVSAQTATTTKTEAANASTAAHKEGEWRASKLVGVNVYNDSNEKIGDINDVILDKSGKATSAVLGVGGFLGMGEHYVAVAFDKLNWADEPVRSSTASTSSAPTSGPATNVDNTRTTTGAATTATVRSANEHWYPDHAVFNATKEQLKELPQFKY